MMKLIIFPVLILSVVLSLSGFVQAADPAPRTKADCSKIYDACYAQCRKKHPQQDLSGDAARTACGTTCAAGRTSCLAEIEFKEKARPALEQVIEDIKKFLDDFLEQVPGSTPDKSKDSDQVKT